MLFRLLIWLSLWNWFTSAQPFHIEDIPIEHYEHEDHQNDEIDVELMPRSARFLSFSQHETDDNNNEQYYNNNNSRPKRNAKNPLKVVEEIGKPLELMVIDFKNITETVTENTSSTEQTTITPAPIEDKPTEENNILINDFIRFKRLAQKVTDQKESRNQDFQGFQTGGRFVQANPEGSIGHHEDNKQTKDNTRETRGVTKDQWVKQPYSANRDESSQTSDSLRAPSVHFVTNNMKERDPLEYKFDRQPRSRSLNKYSPADLSTEMDYYQPRFARNYIPRERYFERPRDGYRQDYLSETRNYIPEYNRKRRIIYYATLPDISRNSRDDDYRPPVDRYGFRDRYDDRYSYQDRYSDYRRRYYEPRYEINRSRDPTYPVKVTTDVKVREVKKNPERRIYSDVDRTRYESN